MNYRFIFSALLLLILLRINAQGFGERILINQDWYFALNDG